MEEFDGRELRLKANMEVALERACALLPDGQGNHESRKFIAQKIIDAANEGRSTLSDLTEAARQAVGLLRHINPTGQGGGTLA